MKVVIEQTHCIGRTFLSNVNCPLCAAIKEQHPSFPLWTVSGGFIRSSNLEVFHFNSSFFSGWCYQRVEELKSGKISRFELDIPVPEYDNKQMLNSEPEAQVCDATKADSSNAAGKIKTVYVSVPTSITEQSKELILS